MDLARTSSALTQPRHRGSDVALEEIESSEEGTSNVAFREDVPPDGGYGWICTLSVFIINANTWGVNSSWAVILAYYLSHKTYQRATHLEYALIGGLSISQALLISPVVTMAQRYFGLRSTLLLGTVLVFAALFTSSYTTQLWQLFLSQGVCFGWGMGFLYNPASSALPPWFSTWRSLAVGLATAGAGIGGLLYSLVTNAAISNLGIAWTYRVLAEFGRIEVLLVVFWGVVTELGYITLLYSLPSYASSVGLTATQGSVANALLNLGLGLGRPLVGYFSDAFGRINMTLATTITCSILCFVLWIPSQSFGPLAAFALLVGGVCGTFWAAVTPVLVEVVGLSRLARTFGVVCLAMVLPTTFAEPVAMQLVDGQESASQSFLGAQIFVACAFVAGTVSVLLLRSWQITRMDAMLEATSSDDPSLFSNRGVTRRKRDLSWLAPRVLFSLRRV
ncbi:Major facilitator superfamily domain, general substrate transporter [Pleurostoma richardsiae]|uniref:Major facilitator superfamily domain, general substrate transporter n=1 Tax=Pleurostoma richardsiae TaxID=41990 RepID=A0AA38VDB3_9PEZI|nr:Major facilitator superfamily domain, general substrate transporter [Pleurostoma richardsiae]